MLADQARYDAVWAVTMSKPAERTAAADLRNLATTRTLRHATLARQLNRARGCIAQAAAASVAAQGPVLSWQPTSGSVTTRFGSRLRLSLAMSRSTVASFFSEPDAAQVLRPVWEDLLDCGVEGSIDSFRPVEC